MRGGECKLLILGQKENDQIKIGDDIVITVVNVSNGRVKIGIDAPRNVEIRRKSRLDGKFVQGYQRSNNIEMEEKS